MRETRIDRVEHGTDVNFGALTQQLLKHLASARMLFELLMLGEPTPQVIAFILEQENHYVAPAFRLSLEAASIRSSE